MSYVDKACNLINKWRESEGHRVMRKKRAVQRKGSTIGSKESEKSTNSKNKMLGGPETETETKTGTDSEGGFPLPVVQYPLSPRESIEYKVWVPPAVINNNNSSNSHYKYGKECHQLPLLRSSSNPYDDTSDYSPRVDMMAMINTSACTNASMSTDGNLPPLIGGHQNSMDTIEMVDHLENFCDAQEKLESEHYHDLHHENKNVPSSSVDNDSCNNYMVRQDSWHSIIDSDEEMPETCEDGEGDDNTAMDQLNTIYDDNNNNNDNGIHLMVGMALGHIDM
jgi:hypothetical protein